jgi:hypothetical protein
MSNELTKYDDYTFYLICHLLALLSDKAKLKSVFSYLPKAHYPKTNFIFTIHNKAIILNLETLKELSSESSLITRIINYINMLKVSVDEESEGLDLETRISMKEMSQEESSSVIIAPSDPGLPDKLPDTIIDESRKKRIDEIKERTPDEDIVVQIEKEKNKEADKYIESIPNITPAQKNRLKIRANKYKEIKLGDKTIQEILETPIDTTVVKRELDFLDDKVLDKSMLKSSIMDFDQYYMEKVFEKHLVQVVTHFNKNGLYLLDLKYSDQIDELNKIRTYKIQYENEEGKVGTLSAKMPIIEPDGTFKINGIKSRMKPQFINTPICKLSDTRVSLAASYKTLIERNTTKAHSFNVYIKNLIEKINEEKLTIQTSLGNREYKQKLPYEYTQLGKIYSTLEIPKNKVIISTDFDNRDELNIKKIETESLEKEHGVLCGRIGNNDYLFMGLDNYIRVYDSINKEIKDTTTLCELIYDQTDTSVRIPMVSEWTDLKIFDKRIPIIFVLAYRFGFTNTLKYLNINYRTIDKGKKIDTSPSEISIRFKDKTLVIDRYPLEKSLIVAGLLNYKLNQVELNELDNKDAYFSLLSEKGLSTNYMIGIDTFYDTFLDPITIGILDTLGEPTNIRDLLIRATVLLTTEEYIEPSSMKNHILRSYSRLNSILYDEIARSLASYKNKKNKNNAFSINPEAVLQRIIQDNAVIAVEEINPVHAIKEKTGFTFTGVGGRTAQSFVMSDRQFPKDGVGIVSEAVPDSGKVAINGYLSMDPNITSLYGTLGIKEDLDKVEPTEALSVTAALMPGATHDDQGNCFV